MKGKKYANMQQEWMMNINKYVRCEESSTNSDEAATCYTDKEEQHKLWHRVIDTVSKFGCTLDSREERIVLCTLSYAVYDLMVDRIKDYKLQQTPTATAPSTSDTSNIKLKESNINLYRYGGFALHSMICKRNKLAEQKLPIANELVQTELRSLHSMQISKDRWNELPTTILDLNQGGLRMVVPEMLPFLRKLVEKVAFNVNDDIRQEHGQNLIKLAISKKSLENDSELWKSFES